jgi:hypothetical protein
MIPLSRSLHFSVYIVHSIDSGLEIFTAGRWLDHKRRQKKIRQRGKQGMASMVPMDKSKRQAEISSPAISPSGLVAPGSWPLTSHRDPRASFSPVAVVLLTVQSKLGQHRLLAYTGASHVIMGQCAGHRRREVRAAVAGLSPASANRRLAEHDRQ